MELWPQILRRQQEEAIVSIVPLSSQWLADERQRLLQDSTLDDFLKSRNWSESDFTIHISRPECLRRYAQQHFGPGLEELFLSSQGGHDQVIYSMLRVKDKYLAQELWIRLEENESSFAELAASYGEGSESARKGILGPLPIGSIHPTELASLLRSLQPGEIHPPVDFGNCFVLIRLEQLTTAKFDSKMKNFLLNQKLDQFLDDRVQKLLANQPLEPFSYDPIS